jgi:adenylylsulfate kinase
MNRIIWFTGQSGSGKTTLAKRLREDYPCIILDGDEMRDSISVGAGFSKEDRAEHNLRVARLAKILAKQTNVLVSVIAPMKNIRREIEKICQPTWVYLYRTLPARDGHFYEESCGYITLNHDTMNIEESVAKLKRII